MVCTDKTWFLGDPNGINPTSRVFYCLDSEDSIGRTENTLQMWLDKTLVSMPKIILDTIFVYMDEHKTLS